MPIYEYKCLACENVTELLMRLKEPAPDFRTCKECGGVLKKIFPTKGSFALKGKGWAKDGYTK